MPDSAARRFLTAILGHRLLLARQRGQRGGRTRRWVLEVVAWDPVRREATAIAGFGRHGAERFEALESGRTEVRIGAERFEARTRRVEGVEAFAVFSDFERRNRLLMPLARPVVSRLAGFAYDGSPDARRRLLERMPLIGLRDEARDGP